MPDALRYEVTGPLQPDSANYVERSADDELLKGLIGGRFCYVLSGRQMGKSSLRARTVEKLRAAGIRVAEANLQAGAGVESESQWYEGVVEQIVDSALRNPGFEAPFEWGAWWDAQRGPFAQRFVNFLREFLLAAGESKWVVTVDEIDATISLGFSDGFFTAIRLCYDQRPSQPEFSRISFVLLGVATPTELVKDRARTPFNIGMGVELAGFTLAEAGPLSRGLGGSDQLRRAAIERILYWTGGQPHLTQNICAILASRWEGYQPTPDEEKVKALVDAIVQEAYFSGEVFKEAHFAYIATQRVGNYPRRAELLRVLKAARSERGCAASKAAAEVAELKISGLGIVGPDGRLRVANRIYHHLFDDAWIASHMPPQPWRAPVLAAAAVLLILACGWFFYLGPRLDRQAARDADIFAAARILSSARSDVPRHEYELLSKVTDQEISNSIEKGLKRAGADAGGADSAALATYMHTSGIAPTLWQRYWDLRCQSLTERYRQMVSGGNPAMTDQQSEEIGTLAEPLVEGLAEGGKIAEGINEAGDECLELLVRFLWEPLPETSAWKTSAKPRPERVEPVLARLEFLANTATSLTRIASLQALKEQWGRLLHGSDAAQVQTLNRRDSELEMQLKKENPKTEVPEISRTRGNAMATVLAGIADECPPTLASEFYRSLPERWRESRDADLPRLTKLIPLEGLAARIQDSDLNPLAKDFTDLIAHPATIESSALLVEHVTAFDTLAERMKFRDASPLALRIAEVLVANGEKLKEDKLAELTRLFERLPSVVSKTPKNRQKGIAVRAAMVVVAALEADSGSFADPERSNLFSAIGLWTRLVPAEIRLRLAEVMVSDLEHTALIPDYSVSQVVNLLSGFAWQQPADRLIPLADRLAAGMSKAGGDLESSLLFSEALHSLSESMEQEDSRRFSTIATDVLLGRLDHADAEACALIFPHLNAWSARLDEVAAALAAERTLPICLQMMERENPFEDDLITDLASRTSPRGAKPLAQKAATILEASLDDPGSRMEKVRGDAAMLLAALGKRMGAEAANPILQPLAIRILGLWENSAPPPEDSDDPFDDQNEVLPASFSQLCLASEDAILAEKGARLFVRDSLEPRRSLYYSVDIFRDLAAGLTAPAAKNLLLYLLEGLREKPREINAILVMRSSLVLLPKLEDGESMLAYEFTETSLNAISSTERLTIGMTASQEFRRALKEISLRIPAKQRAATRNRILDLFIRLLEQTSGPTSPVQLSNISGILRDQAKGIPPEEGVSLARRVLEIPEQKNFSLYRKVALVDALLMQADENEATAILSPLIASLVAKPQEANLRVLALVFLNHPSAPPPAAREWLLAFLKEKVTDDFARDTESAWAVLLLASATPGTFQNEALELATQELVLRSYGSSPDLASEKTLILAQMKDPAFIAFSEFFLANLEAHRSKHPEDEIVVGPLIEAWQRQEK